MDLLIIGLLIVVIVGMAVTLRHSRKQLAQENAQREEALEQLRLSAEAAAKDVRASAEAYHEDMRASADRIMADAEDLRAEVRGWAESERENLREERAASTAREQRLLDRENRLSSEAETLAQRRYDLNSQIEALAERERQVAQAENRYTEELSRIGGLTAEAARAEFLQRVEHDARLEAVSIAREIEAEAKREGDAKAREVIVSAIHRLATEQTSESTVAAIDLPGDDMKGRIIGREGRNIRAFEQITGVNILIDDTPESALLSCFDPVRREVARLTLTELVADGRIHPARIEEVHERCQDLVQERILRAAEDALAEMRITDMHPNLKPILGSLMFRTSYGQNVLRHLLECGHLAAMMASELGLDPVTCRRAAFLHDIGKALTHESEGSHAAVGAALARKYGEAEEIAHAIEAHHNEIEPTTAEAVLTQAADAISGSRPGARREALEAYVQRLEKMEALALSYDGVDRVFAMQAGREIRVMVAPAEVDDIAAQGMARDIAKRVQDELTYPGQVRVTVVRESRATEYAR
ncbi:MAG: ribonuclease Y [Propionibacteriales bacterium]|nr:MAG: ribonuclease Y [Propionibacteriales bacterium]